MIMKGPTTKIDPADSQACLTVRKLVVFNSEFVIDLILQVADIIPELEYPVPIYAALKIHRTTREVSYRNILQAGNMHLV